MVTLPDTIKAVQIQEDKTLAVITLPLASQDKVKNLPNDQVLVSH